MKQSKHLGYLNQFEKKNKLRESCLTVLWLTIIATVIEVMCNRIDGRMDTDLNREFKTRPHPKNGYMIFVVVAKANQWRKNSDQINNLESIGYTYAQKWTQATLHSTYEVNSNCAVDIDVKCKTIKI